MEQSKEQREQEAQKVKAQRIRERIAQLKLGKSAGEPIQEDKGFSQESPHDFVQRKMREQQHSSKESQP